MRKEECLRKFFANPGSLIYIIDRFTENRESLVLDLIGTKIVDNKFEIVANPGWTPG